MSTSTSVKSSPRRLRNRPEQVPTTPSHANERATSVPMDEGNLGELSLGDQAVVQQIDDSLSELEGDFRVQEATHSRRNCLLSAIIFSAVLILFAIVIIDTTTNQYIAKGISGFLTWVENNPGIGFVAFVGVNFVCTCEFHHILRMTASPFFNPQLTAVALKFVLQREVLFFPVSILAPGGGFVFAHAFGLIVGVLLGICAVFLGAGLGAILAFLCGRYLVRDSAQHLKEKYPLFEALDIGEHEHILFKVCFGGAAAHNVALFFRISPCRQRSQNHYPPSSLPNYTFQWYVRNLCSLCRCSLFR
jgi:uncharacterized membrane protein YdjX (TVP38/TMEM64 family)